MDYDLPVIHLQSTHRGTDPADENPNSRHDLKICKIDNALHEDQLRPSRTDCHLDKEQHGTFNQFRQTLLHMLLIFFLVSTVAWL